MEEVAQINAAIMSSPNIAALEARISLYKHHMGGFPHRIRR
jgi:hypothetical protein